MAILAATLAVIGEYSHSLELRDDALRCAGEELAHQRALYERGHIPSKLVKTVNSDVRSHVVAQHCLAIARGLHSLREYATLARVRSWLMLAACLVDVWAFKLGAAAVRARRVAQSAPS